MRPGKLLETIHKQTRFAAIAIVLSLSVTARAQVTFVVEQLPAATPLEDTLYISGTFNNWHLRDPRYILQRRIDGKFAVILPEGRGTIEYKFHRGSWAKVETDHKNEYIPNRQFTYGNGEVISVSIVNWQDVGGAKPFDSFIFYFFAVALLAVLSVYYVSRVRNAREKQIRALQAFLAFIAILLFGRVMYEITSLKSQHYYALVAELLLILSGPLWYFVIAYSSFGKRTMIVHSLPAALAFSLILMKLINVEALQFLSAEAVSKIITWNTVVFYGLAFASNVFYCMLGWRTYRFMKLKSENITAEVRFVKHLLVAAVFFVAALYAKVVILLSDQESWLIVFDRDVVFVAATVFPVVIAYHAFRYEDIFRTPAIQVKTEDLESLKLAVDTVMKEKKCFQNQHLTLTEFAEMVNIKPHLLSKVINECYHQNFRDFVNKYRVEEFIRIAQKDSNKHFTFLALANEVGFNSKSTFNAAFKKVTNRSPREFFKANKNNLQFESSE